MSIGQPRLILRLRGGLGNQMFQYAAARALSLRHNLRLALDAHTGFEGDPYQRRYELGCFNLSAELLAPEEARAILRRCRVRRFAAFLAERIAIRKFGQFHIPLPRLWFARGDLCLENRFQSYVYFHAAAEVIRAEFAFRAPPPEKREIAKLIQNSDAISLHVRFTHGLSEDGKPICTSQLIQPTHELLRAFYRKALAAILPAAARPRIFLFSDTGTPHGLDLDGVPVTVLRRRPDDPPWQDMWLMSLCRINIVANSSYSWWAAWLNPHPQKRVYAPEQYLPFQSKHKPKNVYPPDWIVL